MNGYAIFLNDALYYNSTDFDSTINLFLLTNLTVGNTYEIKVAAKNEIGVGQNASISLVASSPPPKLAIPQLVSATHASVTVQITIPSYTGGSPVTTWVYRRDDGDLVWQT